MSTRRSKVHALNTRAGAHRVTLAVVRRVTLAVTFVVTALPRTAAADEPRGAPGGSSERARAAAVPAEGATASISEQAVLDEPTKLTDGVYGRFEGDLDLALAAGAAIGNGGPQAAAFARAIFLQTAGIYVAYTDAMGRDDAALPRSLGVGVTLRPFFIPRWAFNLERGPAILDLTLDALGFDLGVLWPADLQGTFSERPGMEAALGTEVPLLGSASGPFVGVRGALRWRAAQLAGSAPSQLEPMLFVTLAWHTLVDAHVVDVGDRVLR